MILYFIFLLTSLMLSAFFSGSETGFITANRLKFEIKWRQNPRRFRHIHHFLSKPERFILTILIGNNISNVIFSTIAALILVDYFPHSMSESVRNLLIITISSFILLVMGESFPKSVAVMIPNIAVKKSALLLRLFEYLFIPLYLAVNSCTAVIQKIMGVRLTERINSISKEELELFVRESSKHGYFDKELQTLFSKVIRLKKQQIREILIPRTEMITLPLDTPVAKAMQLFIDSGFTRLPVYQDTIDNIVGVIDARDFLIPPQSIEEVLTEPFFVPATQFSIKLFHEMRKKHISMGIVIEEYGGILGLLTIEDLLEQLIGEIFDEFDVEEKLIKKIADNSYSINCRVAVSRLNEKLQLNLPAGDYATLAGLLESRLGRIPKNDEIFDFKECRIEIVRASAKKIFWVNLSPRTNQKSED